MVYCMSYVTYPLLFGEHWKYWLHSFAFKHAIFFLQVGTHHFPIATEYTTSLSGTLRKPQLRLIQQQQTQSTKYSSPIDCPVLTVANRVTTTSMVDCNSVLQVDAGLYMLQNPTSNSKLLKTSPLAFAKTIADRNAIKFGFQISATNWIHLHLNFWVINGQVSYQPQW